MNTPFKITLPNLENINSEIAHARTEHEKNKKFVIKTILFLTATAVAVGVGIHLLEKSDAATPYAD